MKKLLLAILPILTVSYAYAQNTVWPSTTSSNNVGIGTTTANQKLTINGGGIGFDWNSTDKKLYSPADGDLEWVTQNGAGVHGFAVSSNGNRIIYFNTNGYSYLNGGNVGIGTPNPSAKLSIQGTGTVSNTGASAIADFFGTFDRTRLTIGNSTTTPGGTRSSAILFYGMNANGNAYKNNWEIGNDIGAHGINDFYIFSVDLNNAPFYISATGNVGIGTAVPGGYKLAVAGTIHTQAVNVDMAGWGDYVFAPKYKLASLRQLENYINQYHHLPDMPSEGEVIKNGIDVGKIAEIQTKKIEELTLYLIALKKENDALKKEQTGINRKLKRHHLN